MLYIFFAMEPYYFSIPRHYYPLQSSFESLRVHILVHGFLRLEGWRFTNAGDPFWRLYWNNREGAYVKYDGKVIDLGPDAVVLIPPSRSFSADLEKPVDHFYMHFVLDTPYTVTRFDIWRVAAHVVRRSLIREVIALGRRDGLGGQTGSIPACELVLDVLKDLPAGVWMDQHLDPRIRQALELIGRQEHAGSVDNAMLADAAHMNAAAFVRLFSRRMGIPPMRYALERRLERAGILLSHADRSIDQIASECGFCDRGHLSKYFKRRFGIGPAQYRKRPGMQ